jgi:hypothetical protein
MCQQGHAIFMQAKLTQTLRLKKSCFSAPFVLKFRTSSVKARKTVSRLVVGRQTTDQEAG